MKNTKNNELIARFLGWELRNMPVYLNGGGEMWMSPHKTSTFCSLVGEELFHKSWDWLIPVVEKIESIYDDYHGYFGVFINSNCCTIQGTKLNPGLVNAYFNEVYSDTKLESTYRCVIDFIKWYNKTLKS
jgi:hypothetical protein